MENITLTIDQFETLLTRLDTRVGGLCSPPEPPDEDEICRNYIADVLSAAARSWVPRPAGKLASLKKEVMEFLKDRL